VEKIILITCILVVSGCSHNRDFSDEEREEYMEEESRKDLRDRMTEDIRNDMMF
jgi:Tfp pilus assembly protein PilP